MAQLERIRIGVIEAKGEEGVVFSQKKALVAANKMDLDYGGENYRSLQDKYGEKLPIVAISAIEGNGLEELRLKIYQRLDIIRVYTKAPGQKPDFADPIILEKRGTLEEAAASVHKDFAAGLRYARLWDSGKHDGIMVKKDYVLQDGDIIELHM